MAQGGPAIPGASCPRGAAPVGPAAPGQPAPREETITPIKIIVKENFTMKKFLSAVLALAMAFALCTTAFAEDGIQKAVKDTVTITTVNTDKEGYVTDGENQVKQWNIDVKAGYADSFDAGQVPAKYYVVLSWEVNSTLKYTIGADSYTWNVYDASEKESAEDGFTTATHAGYKTSGGKWTGTATVDVKLENWSNRNMAANLSWAAAEGIAAAVGTAVTMNETTITTNSAASADKTATVNTPVTANTTVSIDGTQMAGAITEAGVIGTLTVTVKDVTA